MLLRLGLRAHSQRLHRHPEHHDEYHVRVDLWPDGLHVCRDRSVFSLSCHPPDELTGPVSCKQNTPMNVRLHRPSLLSSTLTDLVVISLFLQVTAATVCPLEPWTRPTPTATPCALETPPSTAVGRTCFRSTTRRWGERSKGDWVCQNPWTGSVLAQLPWATRLISYLYLVEAEFNLNLNLLQTLSLV